MDKDERTPGKLFVNKLEYQQIELLEMKISVKKNEKCTGLANSLLELAKLYPDTSQ